MQRCRSLLPGQRCFAAALAQHRRKGGGLVTKRVWPRQVHCGGPQILHHSPTSPESSVARSAVGLQDQLLSRKPESETRHVARIPLVGVHFRTMSRPAELHAFQWRSPRSASCRNRTRDARNWTMTMLPLGLSTHRRLRRRASKRAHMQARPRALTQASRPVCVRRSDVCFFSRSLCSLSLSRSPCLSCILKPLGLRLPPLMFVEPRKKRVRDANRRQYGLIAVACPNLKTKNTTNNGSHVNSCSLPSGRRTVALCLLSAARGMYIVTQRCAQRSEPRLQRTPANGWPKRPQKAAPSESIAQDGRGHTKGQAASGKRAGQIQSGLPSPSRARRTTIWERRGARCPMPGVTVENIAMPP